jgi:hypothetical protein
LLTSIAFDGEMTRNNPLMVNEVRDDLTLRFKRLNMKSKDENENEVVEDFATFDRQVKGKCQNCGFIGRNAQDALCCSKLL